MTMNVLVTGGAGFIGRHLVSKLLSQGHKVNIYDNFSSSEKFSTDAKIIEGDIRDSGDVARAMKGVEAVFHLAAISDMRADEDLIYNTNFIGSKNVFEAAKEAGAKIVFTSSSAVYGETKLAKETDECHPANQYGKSKLRAEKICPEGFITRLFNVYGPNGRGVVNKFCKLIPKYEDVNVFGHGTQTRDFIYVDDVVAALVMGLNLQGVYNIGTGKETSLLELIDAIHAMTKSKPNIKFLPHVAGDVQRSKADISKIQQTEWFPKVELQDGIRKVLLAEGFDFSVIENLK